MLLTKEVEVALRGKNIPYYENLGYKIPRHKDCNGRMCVPSKTTIIVKVEDLPAGSNKKVELECDNCGKHSVTDYYVYCNQNHNGLTYCVKCANKLFNSGKNHSNYNPLITDEEREMGRNYPEYVDFVKRVQARDNYTCQCCGQKHKKIEVHHLDGYDWCKEKRTDDTNGILLCHNCHRDFHNKYGLGGNTKEQFEEWIGYTLENLNKYNGTTSSTRKLFDYEENKVYDSVFQYTETHNCNNTSVYKCCNHKVTERKYINKDGTIKTRQIRSKVVKGHHLFWLDEYEKMTDDDIEKYINDTNRRFRKIICVTTGEVFISSAEAKRKYDIYSSGIIDCCSGKILSVGKLLDGTKLQWMYYDEYLEKINNGEEIYIRDNSHHVKVICVTTGIIFNQVKIAGQKYNIKTPSAISSACRGKLKSAGKLEDGTPLKWMYYEDFLKLPQEEQNEILSRNKGSSTNEPFSMQ